MHYDRLALAIGSAALLAAGEAFGGQRENFTPASTALLASMVLLSWLAISIWRLLLKCNRVSTVTAFNVMAPVFGVILSGVLLDESILEWRNAVVCIGIWLVTQPPRTG